MASNAISFVGFSFNGVHSSELNIVRTSDGSRFNTNLLPTSQDKTIQVPGGDGTYYFGSYYTQKPIVINYAFDSLTEKQYARLSELFGDKKIHPLVFDEAPYKTYNAKVTGTASIKYIPFDNENGETIYKGEGSINFTVYSGYAQCNHKWLDDPYYDNFKNDISWIAPSGLKGSRGTYDKIKDTQIKLYNPGVIDSHFQLRIDFMATNGDKRKIPAGEISIINKSGVLRLKEIAPKDNDEFIKINTKLNLIEGYINIGSVDEPIYKKTGNIYNEYIQAGSFFQIPRGESTMVVEMSENIVQNVDIPIEYNYYYY